MKELFVRFEGALEQRARADGVTLRPRWRACCLQVLVSNEAGERGTPIPESVLPVVPGQLIGDRYLIGSVIGEGGMGVVCAATHVALGTPVAVKLIHSALKHDPESVLRFLNEARTAASLKGDHIARVYDVGQLESGEPYLVMEQLDGMGLDAFIRERGPLSQADAVDIVLQACEGLAEAHAVALVHRDIKPANLFLATRPDGSLTLKILDFGISKRLLDSVRRGLTDPGRSLGSPSYMSPEQMMDSSQVDQRADVWSLGILLYELLTNECPFVGESVPQVCAAVLTAPAPRPSDLRSEVDSGLDAVVLHCLEKDPGKRYSSVALLADAIRPFAARSGSLAPFLAAAKPRRPRRFSAMTLMSLLAVGALLAGVGWSSAQAFPMTTALSRVRLPWDPVLRPGPTGDQVPSLSHSFQPLPLQIITAPRSAPDEPSAVPLGDSAPVPTLTKAEIQRRTERYRSGQRDQALVDLSEGPSQEASIAIEPVE